MSFWSLFYVHTNICLLTDSWKPRVFGNLGDHKSHEAMRNGPRTTRQRRHERKTNSRVFSIILDYMRILERFDPVARSDGDGQNAGSSLVGAEASALITGAKSANQRNFGTAKNLGNQRSTYENTVTKVVIHFQNTEHRGPLDDVGCRHHFDVPY